MRFSYFGYEIHLNRGNFDRATNDRRSAIVLHSQINFTGCDLDSRDEIRNRKRECVYEILLSARAKSSLVHGRIHKSVRE